MKKPLYFVILLLLSFNVVKPIDKEYYLYIGASLGLAGAAAAAVCAGAKLLEKNSLDENAYKKIGIKPASVGIAYFSIKHTIDTVEDYLGIIDAIKQNKEIRGCIVSIESPGGSPGSSDMLRLAIKELAKHKPVVAMIGNYSFSGGYLAACGAPWIIADPMAQLGNIGTRREIAHFIEVPKGVVNGLKGSVDIEPFFSGKYKVTGHPNTVLTNDERTYLQDDVTKGYDLFCSIVESERPVDSDRTIWADGKTFWGKEAEKIGLVDQCGGWDDVKEKIERMVAIHEKRKPGRKQVEIFSYGVKEEPVCNLAELKKASNLCLVQKGLCLLL